MKGPIGRVARRLAAAFLTAGLLAGCIVVAGRPGAPPGPQPERAEPVPVTVAPTLVVIAGTPVAYAENWPEDLFYYGGRWYRPYRGTWYAAAAVGGPWVRLAAYRVPRAVLQVPRDYRARARVVPPAAALPPVVVQAPPPQLPPVVVQAPPPRPPVVVQAPPPQPPPVIVQAPPPARGIIAARPPAVAAALPHPVPPAVQAPVAEPPAPAPRGPVPAELPAGPPPQVAHEGGRRAGPPPWAPARGARAKEATPPPVTVTPAPVLIPGTPVAYAENWPEDLFLFEGRWYRPFEGSWYWSAAVSGGWTHIAPAQVPKAILEVPRDYRKKAKGGPPSAAAHGKGRK